MSLGTLTSLRRGLLFAAVAIAILLAAGALLLSPADLDKRAVVLEIFKSGLQVITVLIFGQVIALVVKDYEYVRQAALARHAVLEDWRTRLIVGYISAKRHRRLLRAAGLSAARDGPLAQHAVVHRDAYRREMESLNECELQLESLWHDVAGSDTESIPFRDEIRDGLENMKDYLRHILHQYENGNFRFDSTDTLPLAALEGPDSALGAGDAAVRWLSDFVGRTKGSRFKSDFIEPFRRSQHALNKALLRVPAA